MNRYRSSLALKIASLRLIRVKRGQSCNLYLVVFTTAVIVLSVEVKTPVLHIGFYRVANLHQTITQQLSGEI